MLGKSALLLIVYGGPSVAALLVLLLGVAIARTRAEAMGVGRSPARWCWSRAGR